MPTYDFFDHPRFLMLAGYLAAHGASTPAVYGHVALFERYMVKYRLDGDVTDIPDAQIDAAVQWSGTPGAFAAALRYSGLLYVAVNGREYFRGWIKHAPEFVKKKMARAGISADDAGRAPAAVSAKMAVCPPNGPNGGQSAQTADKVPVCPPNGPVVRQNVDLAAQSRVERRGGAVMTPDNSASARALLTPNSAVRTARKGIAGAVAVESLAEPGGKRFTPREAAAVRRVLSTAAGEACTPEQFASMPPHFRAQMLASELGADVSFRTALGDAVRRAPERFVIVWRAFLACVNRGNAVNNRPGWFRDALRRDGFEL